MKKEIGIGFLIGVITPIIMMFVLSFTPFNRFGVTFFDFIEKSYKAHALSALFSLACILNLVVFWFLNRNDKVNHAKGIVLGTFIYAFYIAWDKFL